MRRFLALFAVLMFSGTLALAQDHSVKGHVMGPDGNSLPGITVQVEGSNTATATNSSGQFELTVSPNANLIFSGIGYERLTLNVGDKSTLDVQLVSTTEQLQEVVVTGYTTSTKESFTGSAKVVSSEELSKKDVSNISQALAGEVPGVRVINSSGQPGTSATIRIRGIGSVNGNRSPLYVVDGVAYSGSLNAINPSDIASITVLKDAAATAIYGVDGSNGVIVITTNSGKGKKSFIELDTKYGVNKSILPRYKVLTSPEEYIALAWEGLHNEAVSDNDPDPTATANANLFSPSGISPNYNIWNVTDGSQLIDPSTRKVLPGVTRKYNPERWEDYAFQPSNRSEVNLKMGGGTSKSNYYSSLGFIKDNGYSINSNFTRFSARLGLNQEVKSWLTTDFNINYANTASNDNGQGSSSNSIFWFVDNIPSIYPLFLHGSDGNKVADPIFGGYQYDYGASGRKFGSLTNAIADAHYNTLLTKQNNISGSGSFTIKFTKNISLQNRLGVQYFNQDYWERDNKFYGSAASQNGSIYQQKQELLNLNLLNMLRYKNQFGAHNLEVLAAHEATDYNYTTSIASGYNLVDNYSLELANAIVKNPTSTSYVETNNLESYFGQVNYDFNKTYYLSATIRRDGSSRFIKGNAWGTFGAVGLGWELTRMNFMNTQQLFDYLKLKASYGVIGDQSGLGYYPGYNEIDIGNLNDNPSFGTPIPGNPDLTWETSKMLQGGIEFRLGRFLTGTVEYYVKNTDNLIFQRRVGPSNGYALITVNDGQLRNQGIDFDLTAHILKKKDFYLDFGINGEHFNNKITTMPIDPSTGKPKNIDVQSPYGWSKGHSIYDFYVRDFAGVDPEDGTSTWVVYYQDENNNNKYDAGEGKTDLEDFYGKNPDMKGKLLKSTTKVYSDATQYYVGKSGIPKIRGAFNLNAGYKGVSLSVQFLYSVGGYAYDGAYAVLMDNGLVGGNNWAIDVRKRWQKPGDKTNVPRLSDNADANVASTSSRFIEKAGYLTLNNIRLAYTFPESLLRNQKVIDNITIFVSGDNLWLLSARDGFNPSAAENGNSDMYRYSPLSTLTAGLKARF
jgi:TonB-linked SusC/RagA family outer membrane protein